MADQDTPPEGSTKQVFKAGQIEVLADALAVAVVNPAMQYTRRLEIATKLFEVGVRMPNPPIRIAEAVGRGRVTEEATPTVDLGVRWEAAQLDGGDRELLAMGVAVRALGPLDRPTRKRVVGYLYERIEAEAF